MTRLLTEARRCDTAQRNGPQTPFQQAEVVLISKQWCPSDICDEVMAVKLAPADCSSNRFRDPKSCGPDWKHGV